MSPEELKKLRSQQRKARKKERQEQERKAQELLKKQQQQQNQRRDDPEESKHDELQPDKLAQVPCSPVLSPTSWPRYRALPSLVRQAGPGTVLSRP